MKTHKSILIFTDKYPFGSGESFFEAELKHLSNTFETITILPLESSNGSKPRSLPSNVILIKPPLNSSKNKTELLVKGLINQAPILCFLKEFFSSRVFLSPKKFRNWLTHFLLIRAELAFLKSRKELDIDAYDLNYFYWGLRWSQILPFIKHQKAKVIVRFHGSDLYEERNHNYIPFRKDQVKRINLAVFVSEMGKNYLEERYRGFLQKTAVARLGTEDFGVGKYISNHKLHIVSCSNIIALKQIDLLARALKYLNVDAQWTHIGDGPLKNEIQKVASETNNNITITFKGQLDRIALMRFYQQTPVDVFVNTSLSEGVPVSVMEALSFGIPVIATDVGGTREIVDSSVGFLISPNISAEELANKIELLWSNKNYLQLRQNSRKRWEERCRGDVLFSDFSKLLKHI